MKKAWEDIDPIYHPKSIPSYSFSDRPKEVILNALLDGSRSPIIKNASGSSFEFSDNRPQTNLTNIYSPQSVFHQVSGELGKNIRFIKDFKTLEELEADLYELTREYKIRMDSPRIRLDSIWHIHHLMQLQDCFLELSDQDRIILQRDIEALLHLHPWASTEYKWYLKVIGFINLLTIKWDLVSCHRYAYRNFDTLPTSSIEANELARRQTMIFTVGTLWLAINCTFPPLCYKTHENTQALSGIIISRFIGIVRYLMSLNYNADFYMHRSIRGFCGERNHELEVLIVRKRHEKTYLNQEGFSISGAKHFELPHYQGLITSEHVERAKRNLKPTFTKQMKKTRRALSASIGFHILELPANFCKCLDTSYDKVNLKLYEMLHEFENAYRVFEYSAISSSDSKTPKNIEVNREAEVLPYSLKEDERLVGAGI